MIVPGPDPTNTRGIEALLVQTVERLQLALEELRRLRLAAEMAFDQELPAEEPAA